MLTPPWIVQATHKPNFPHIHNQDSNAPPRLCLLPQAYKQPFAIYSATTSYAQRSTIPSTCRHRHHIPILHGLWHVLPRYSYPCLHPIAMAMSWVLSLPLAHIWVLPLHSSSSTAASPQQCLSLFFASLGLIWTSVGPTHPPQIAWTCLIDVSKRNPHNDHSMRLLEFPQLS